MDREILRCRDRKALEAFLRLQMRAPEKIQRLLEHLAIEDETGGNHPTIPSNTITFEDISVTLVFGIQPRNGWIDSLYREYPTECIGLQRQVEGVI